MAGTGASSVITGRNPVAYSASDPLALFIIQLLIIVCLCRALHVVIRRVYQPMVISEIIGGIVLGPTVLGRWEAFATNVFPKESLTNLSLVSNFGLVLFLFMVGLELDPRILKRNFHRSLAISLAGIVLPFGLGTATSYALYTLLMDSKGSFTTFLLFCGVAMAITAFPVLARILTEQNLLKTTVGSIAISAAAIDDVVSWCLLALVLALTNNSSGISALWVFLAGAGWVLFVLLAVRPVYMWYLRRSGVLRGREPSQMVLFVTFVMVLISSYYTDIIGIHAIFGAFIIGVIVPHDGGFAIKVTEKIEDVVQIFFLPIYFALSGLKTNLSDLNDGTTWGLLVLICVVAFIGKIVGCGLAARFSKFTWRESITIGFLMNCKGLLVLICVVAFIGKIVGCGLAARFSKFTWRESITIGFLMNCKGLVELIVLNIGLQAGVINSKIFTMMVVKALITTFATTPAVIWLYPSKYHRRIDDQEDESDKQSAIKEAADANAGPPLGVLVVLSRIQQVPALMTLLGYMHHQGASNAVTAAAADSGGGLLARVQSRLYRPIRVFGLRLLEHTGRESSVMQHYESASQVASDPVMAMFRAFARIAHMAFHAALAHSDREHFVDNILDRAQDADAELTIVSAFGRGSSAARDMVAARKEAIHQLPDTMTPGWFESLGWGLSTEQQAAFIVALFDRARSNVCVFIDCGLADSSDVTLPAEPADSDVGPSSSGSGAVVQIADDAVAAERKPAPDNVPGVPAGGPVAGRRVPVVVVPFFGGPDDRQALRMAADLCTHAAVWVVVWRFVKASRPNSRDVVLHETQYPAQPNIPRTPAAAQLRARDGSEANPWEIALNDGDDSDGASGKQRGLVLAATPTDAALNEAAERLADDAFIDDHLRPSVAPAARHERRESVASARAGSESGGDGPPLLELAPTTTRETSGSDQAKADEAADGTGGRGGIRHKLTQRLRFRRQASQSADDVGGWSDPVSTLTDGVRSTQFPNMTIKTTVTATPLQTLLLRSRTLSASDLIICGRSVRACLPYFSNAQELQAYTPAGHAHTRGERQQALGSAAEYLLGFGTRASILVVQAAPDPYGPEALRTKRDE
ncbi:K(+)/H(+) antiporter [Coemansia spiralis]|nr:K(+)/H(+) antiporter [Coemansia spiralis]